MRLFKARTAQLAVLADRLVLQRQDVPAVQAALVVPLDLASCIDALNALTAPALSMSTSTSTSTASTLRTGVAVTVQAAWARLLVLPDNPALNAEARWAGYAASRFEALTGEAAEAWTLRVLPERPGRPRLLVALPTPLLQALAAACGRQLRSVRVDALGRLDALRAQAPRFSGAVVEGSERHLLLSLFQRGALQRVRQRRSSVDASELQSMLRVEWAALGHDGPLPVLALGPGWAPGVGWAAVAQRTLVLS